MPKVGILLNINGGGRKEKVEKKEENGQGERRWRRESQEGGGEGQDTKNSLAGGMNPDLLWQEF